MSSIKDQVMMHPFEWKQAAIDGDVASLRRQLLAVQPVNQRNMCGLTALHFAAKDGNEEAVEFLLAEGADATMRSFPGETLPNMTALEMSQVQQVSVISHTGEPLEYSKPAGGRVAELLRAAELARNHGQQ